MTNQSKTTFAGLILMTSLSTHVFAQGTAFTYQGQLNSLGTPVSGAFDLKFALYDLATNAIGTAITNGATSVSNGLFTTTLDFGAAAFSGSPRLLSIGIRPTGSNVQFTVLSPLQQVTPTPYSIYSTSSGSASNLSTTLASTALAGTYGSTVLFTNNADQFAGSFSGNGSGLSNVPASSLNGLVASNFWQTGGNSGTSTTRTNFLGTTDNQAVELRVNSVRALRLEPNTKGAPNLIGGAPNNVVDSGTVGATVSGGGASNYTGGLAYTNRVGSDFGSIGGGAGNQIQTNSTYATISGGSGNSIQSGSPSASIAGGNGNIIVAGAASSFIGGGLLNNIQTNATSSVVSGGQGNSIQTAAGFAAIGGGGGNTIQSTNNYSTISGGGGNTILAGATYATIAGGSQNSASGKYSFAAGQQAQALHLGAFVWADSTAGSFASTTSNEFNIRANGGMRLQTDAANGNVDAAQLVIQGNANPNQQLELGYKTNGNYASIQSTVQGSGVASLALQPAGGNVGINITNPSYALHVNGSVAGVGAYNNVSDARYKTNIKAIPDALAKILAMRGVVYDWKTNEFPNLNFDKGLQIGFIAQEAREVLPEVVSQDQQGYYSIAYSKVIPVLVEALKEEDKATKSLLLQKEARIGELEQRLAELERKMEKLSAETHP